MLPHLAWIVGEKRQSSVAEVVTKQNTGCHDILVVGSHAVRLLELDESVRGQNVELEMPKGRPCVEIHVKAGA